MDLHLHLQAANTRRSYASDVGYFWAWAAAALKVAEAYPVEPATVALFVRQHLEGLPEGIEDRLRSEGRKRKAGPLAVATIERRVAALRSLHRRRRLPEPVDREVLDLLRAGRRQRAAAGGQHKKRAITRDLLDRLLATCEGDGLRGLRDAAILLVGWSSGGRRRSELAAIEVSHLEPDGVDFVLLVPKSKTDQEGVGARVPVAGRAAEALRSWMEAAGLTEGPLFRQIVGDVPGHGGVSSWQVTQIVKFRAELAGLAPAQFGAHSLRSGFLTQCGREGVQIAEAMAMSCHRDVGVALGYHQAGSALKNPAARLAG